MSFAVFYEEFDVSVVRVVEYRTNGGNKLLRNFGNILPVNIVSNTVSRTYPQKPINPLNAELNPICYMPALLGAHHFLHVSRIRVKSLTLRLLMSYMYIYMEHLFLMFLDHTQRRSTVGRTPLDE